MSAVSDYQRALQFDAVNDRLLCKLNDDTFVVYMRGDTAIVPTHLQLFSYVRESGDLELYAEDGAVLSDLFGVDWVSMGPQFVECVRDCLTPVLRLDGKTRYLSSDEVIRIAHLLNAPLHRLEQWLEQDPHAANDPEFDGSHMDQDDPS